MRFHQVYIMRKLRLCMTQILNIIFPLIYNCRDKSHYLPTHLCESNRAGQGLEKNRKKPYLLETANAFPFFSSVNSAFNPISIHEATGLQRSQMHCNKLYQIYTTIKSSVFLGENQRDFPPIFKFLIWGEFCKW